MAAYKVIVLGEIAVGKTSLVRRLKLGRFEADYRATVGVDIYQFEIEPGGDPDGSNGGEKADPVSLMIWDIEGDMAESVLQHYYSFGADAALIVSDATRPETEATAEVLGSEFVECFPGRPFIQAVNKIDLVPEARSGTYETLGRHAERVMLTSALTGEMVGEAFGAVATVLERRSRGG